jgi:hypothetical protein
LHALATACRAPPTVRAALAAPNERLEYRTASRREAVADLEALGKAQLFQLSDATLERQHLGVNLRASPRDDAGLAGDQLQVARHPGRRARGIDSGQPRDDRVELGVLRQAFPDPDARIVAGNSELDA